ncbi:MAG: hypothetical protein ABW278_08700 [Steroidobacteraceae bacterium]
MNATHDDDLRRLFANGVQVPADEGFVAAVTLRVAARRRQQRWQRLALRGLLALAVAGLALLLAPYAPVSPGSPATALLQLPENAAGIAQSGLGQYSALQWPRLNYLYLSLVAGLLPLAGTAWLLRRR